MEIKFRGYSKKYKEMFTYEKLKEASDGMVKVVNKFFKQNRIQSIPCEKGLFLPVNDKDMVLMMFTGMEDITGREIYEGDIVEVIAEQPGDKDFKGVVTYDECAFWIEDKEKQEAIRLFDECTPRRVVGNIYCDLH